MKAELERVKSIQSPALSEEESEASTKSLKSIEEFRQTQQYPILRSFMPLGVFMDAEAARRLAKMLGITSGEYWELVMEDLAMHDHNAIALAHIDKMAAEERDDLLWRCERHGVKILARTSMSYTESGPGCRVIHGVIDRKAKVPHANTSGSGRIQFDDVMCDDAISGNFYSILGRIGNIEHIPIYKGVDKELDHVYRTRAIMNVTTYDCDIVVAIYSDPAGRI